MNFNGLKEFGKFLGTKKKNISNDKSPKTAATKLVKLAKSYAPHDSGDTIKGIKKRKGKKNSYMVISSVPGSFKQNLFADKRTPFLHDERGYKYGDSPIKNFTATKTPFFSTAVKETKKEFPKLVFKNITKEFKQKN